MPVVPKRLLDLEMNGLEGWNPFASHRIGHLDIQVAKSCAPEGRERLMFELEDFYEMQLGYLGQKIRVSLNSAQSNEQTKGQ